MKMSIYVQCLSNTSESGILLKTIALESIKNLLNTSNLATRLTTVILASKKSILLKVYQIKFIFFSFLMKQQKKKNKLFYVVSRLFCSNPLGFSNRTVCRLICHQLSSDGQFGYQSIYKPN